MPLIESLSPSGVPADSLASTWISLRGPSLILEKQSTITLTDPSSKLSVTSQLVECNQHGTEGDACFKPTFVWSSGQGSVEFTQIVIHPVRDSTPVPQTGLSLIYFAPTILSISPTTAKDGDIITVNAPWFSTTRNITCTFVWKKPSNDGGGESVIVQEQSVNIFERKTHCRVPVLDGAHNHIVEIYVTMLNRDFTSKHAPAFFYYLDTRHLTFYDSFDTGTDMFVVDPASSATGSTLLDWIKFDESSSRSVARMTSHVSSTNQRSTIVSQSVVANRVDQQLHLEFVSDTGSSVGNVELCYLSGVDPSYGVYGGINTDTSTGKHTLSIAYQLGESAPKQTKTVQCMRYVPGTAHAIEMKLVRPEMEMMYQNITAFNEWISAQNISINSTHSTPDEPWRIDVMVRQGYTPICSLSLVTQNREVESFKSMLSTGCLGVAQSVSASGQQPGSGAPLVLNIDRIWVSCQFDVLCDNVTHVPKHFANITTAEPNYIQQYGKTVVAAVSSIAGSLLFLLLLIIPITIGFILLWRFLATKKKEKQAKLEAWKFEFVLDKNVSSIDDDNFASVARKIYKVDEDEKQRRNFLSLRQFSNVRDVELEDLSSDMTMTDSEIELLDRRS